MSDEKKDDVAVGENLIDLRSVMRYFPAGVTIVTTLQPEDNSPCGMTVSSFASISLEPPLIAISLKKSSTTAQAVLEQKTFGVSILHSDQENLSNRFAGFDPEFEEQASRFIDLNIHTAQTGAPLLTDAFNWLDCKVWAVHDGSTHHVVLGEVVASSMVNEEPTQLPLIYYNRGYHSL